MKQSRMGNAAPDVDAYLRSVPPDARTALTRLRRTIKASAPGAEETISYAMPAYKLNGPLVYFAAFKAHCSFFPGSKSIMKRFGKELSPFDATGGTIRFSPDHPLPASLVQRIVRARVKENEARRASRSARKALSIT
jgi:uncharacterized protein YdhG (YjbR/CyaY superfamily)